MKGLPNYPFMFSSVEGSATLDPYNQVILVDYRFENYPPICLEWLIEHEKHHVLWDTPGDKRIFQIELSCDLEAAKELRDRGYSKTQILGAMDMVLDPSNEKILRIDYIDRML